MRMLLEFVCSLAYRMGNLRMLLIAVFCLTCLAFVAPSVEAGCRGGRHGRIVQRLRDHHRSGDCATGDCGTARRGIFRRR